MQRKLKNSESLQIRLREAAQELILMQGVNALSVSAIARQAEINRTTFYLIYDSKDDLLRDICENFLTDYMEKFIKSQTGNAIEQKNIIIQTFRDLKEQERLFRAIWNIRSEKFNPYITMQESNYKLTYSYMSQKHKNKENDSALELFSHYYAANTIVEMRIIHAPALPS